MKKTIMNIRTMAALLIASVAFTACSNEDGAVIGEQPAATQTPQVYTLTLQAANATGAQHRALELDGDTKLVAKWAAGDQLTVLNVTTPPPVPLGGTLTASNVSADGKTCTFSGTLTGTIAVDNQLALHYHATSGTQDGTLESAAANDQAFANVTVASVDAGNITIKESKATFNTTTAVLKLTLKDGSANALNATSLKISVDGTDFFEATPTAATYTTNGADGVLYFAVPDKGNAAVTIAVKKNGSPTPDLTDLINAWSTNLDTYTVTFTAKVGDDTYTATKTGYKLAAGKYYATELTMAKPTDLSTISSNYEAKDGEILTGTLASNVKISIAAGATVTLKDVDINGSGTWKSGEYAGITCLGDATIILEGTNTVKGFDEDYPGIFAAVDKTLTIKGPGTLNVSSNGIGAAGIGGGDSGACGNIVISGGTITATGGDGAAGIGSGRGNTDPGGYGSSTCGTITITSGVTQVTATKGSGATNSIGSGEKSTCGTVTIGGTEYASGISQSPYEYPLPALSLTSPAVGEVIGSDGKNYAADATLPTGVTKVAMIAYVNGSNGLAIALADESSNMNWSTAVTAAAAHTPAFTGGTWKLPTQDEWKQMFKANGGDNTKYTGLNTAINTAGGTTLPETAYYWSSSEVEGGVNAKTVYLYSGTGNISWNNGGKDIDRRVRACLAF